MEADQRRIVELQEKKLDYLNKYSNNLVRSIIKSKILEIIQDNTSICMKKCGNNPKSTCFLNCVNKRYEITELLIDVISFYVIDKILKFLKIVFH